MASKVNVSNLEFLTERLGFEVSNRKLASGNRSGYYSKNLASNVFAGAPRAARYNPLNLKFERKEMNDEAKPKDHDILNQNLQGSQQKRGSKRLHKSIDLEFTKPKNRFAKFYFSRNRSGHQHRSLDPWKSKKKRAKQKKVGKKAPPSNSTERKKIKGAKKDKLTPPSNTANIAKPNAYFLPKQHSKDSKYPKYNPVSSNQQALSKIVQPRLRPSSAQHKLHSKHSRSV